MKLKAARFLIGCVCLSMMTGCYSAPQTGPTPTQPPAASATPTPSSTATISIVNSPTPLPAPTATVAPTPTAQASSAAFTVTAPQFNTIALGSYASLTKAGGISYRFRVKQVISGAAASGKITRYTLPASMQWVIVLVEMDYDKGTANQRIQLMSEDEFRIISQGQVLANDYLRYGPVSEHINQINLMPGEMSYGVLLFAVNSQVQNPVLRFSDASDGSQPLFFALTTAAAANTAQPAQQVTAVQFGVNGQGSASHPLPMGKTMAYKMNGATLLFTVKQVQRGFDVSRTLWDLASVKQSPAPGKDFIMPYVEIVNAQSPTDPIDFQAGLFNIVNDDKSVSKSGISCPYPCLADIALYQGGQAQGWLPRSANQSNQNPLLVFNNELYLSLTDTSNPQASASAPVFPANAIGYNTIKNVVQAGALEQPAVVQALAFSPDGKLLASGGDDHKIYIWDVATQKEITILLGHLAAIKSLSFSADGKLLASVSSNDQIILWNVADGSINRQIKQTGVGLFGQFLADGSLATANQAGLITIWNPLSGETVKTYQTQANVSPNCADTSIFSFDISPDGNTFAAALACGYGVVWDPNSGARLATDYNHAIDSGAIPRVSAISVSDSSGLAAYAASFHNNLGYLVDVLDTQEHSVLGGVGTATTNIPSIAFSPNGQVIAAAVGNLVRTWWPSGYVWSGKHMIDLKAHTVQVTSIKFSQDGTLLASGDYSGKIFIWKVAQ